MHTLLSSICGYSFHSENSDFNGGLSNDYNKIPISSQL